MRDATDAGADRRGKRQRCLSLGLLNRSAASLWISAGFVGGREEQTTALRPPRLSRPVAATSAQRRRAIGLTARMGAKRLVEHLERSGFVVMKKPPSVGAAALGRGTVER